jgi:hypothetical protein
MIDCATYGNSSVIPELSFDPRFRRPPTNRIAIGAPAEIGRNTGSGFSRVDTGLTSVYFRTVAWRRLR